jgi:diguanylate cyclase (GGDEF)-like protein
MERTLTRRAHHDPLTGLANRSLLADRLEKALERAQRSEQLVAILFVDLDKFKPVNDSLGHAMGDQVLRRVAQRLQSAVRESDTLARLGGDEFVVVVEALDRSESVVRIADNIVDVLAQPFTIDGHKVQLGCSIGISFFPEHGASMIELMRAADTAMYQAKQSTGQRWCVFSEDDGALSN